MNLHTQTAQCPALLLQELIMRVAASSDLCPARSQAFAHGSCCGYDDTIFSLYYYAVSAWVHVLVTFSAVAVPVHCSACWNLLPPAPGKLHVAKLHLPWLQMMMLSLRCICVHMVEVCRWLSHNPELTLTLIPTLNPIPKHHRHNNTLRTCYWSVDPA